MSGAGIQTSSGGETFNMGARTSTGTRRTRKGNSALAECSLENYAHLCDRSRLSALANPEWNEDYVTVPAGANCADATIRLGPKAAKLRVTVLNGMTQEPIKGAKVWLTGDFEDQGGWSLRVSGDLSFRSSANSDYR